MKKMILNSEFWANAMREKILEKLQLGATVFCTSTEDQFSMYQFREAAHMPSAPPTTARPAFFSRARPAPHHGGSGVYGNVSN